MKKSTTLALTAIAFAAASMSSAFAAETVIGLITKTDSNPFFVKMKEGADAAAKKAGAKLLSAAGKQDGDTATQISAMENMAAAGAKTILITSSGDAIIPTIKSQMRFIVLYIVIQPSNICFHDIWGITYDNIKFPL